MPETFPVLVFSIIRVPWVGISRSASDTDDRFYLSFSYTYKIYEITFRNKDHMQEQKSGSRFVVCMQDWIHALETTWRQSTFKVTDMDPVKVTIKIFIIMRYKKTFYSRHTAFNTTSRVHLHVITPIILIELLLYIALWTLLKQLIKLRHTLRY